MIEAQSPGFVKTKKKEKEKVRIVLPCMCGTMRFVIYWRLMLGTVISPICCSRVPIKSELSLGLAAAEPVKAHVHGFYASKDNGFVDYTNGGGVVSLDG